MKRNLLSVFFAGAGLILWTPAVDAHHSQSAEFDRSQTIDFTGIVKAVEWTNPHGYVQVEVEGVDGNLTVYRVEIQAPNGLYRAGWRNDSFGHLGQPVLFMEYGNAFGTRTRVEKLALCRLGRILARWPLRADRRKRQDRASFRSDRRESDAQIHRKSISSASLAFSSRWRAFCLRQRRQNADCLEPRILSASRSSRCRALRSSQP